MRYALYILSLSVLITACSDNQNEPAKPAGFYTIDSHKDSHGNTVFLRIEDDRMIRYIVDAKNKSYAWESLKYTDGKLNGKLTLEEATCMSTNESNVGQVVEDLSQVQYYPAQDGFLLNNLFFRKLSQNEIHRLLVELEAYSYSCEESDKITNATHETGVITTRQNLTAFLNPQSIQKTELPLISGKVLFTEKNGIKNYILYSDKAYIAFNFNEVSSEEPSLNKVSWIYYELLDGTLDGRKVRLQNSCPPNHPQSSQLATLHNGEAMQKDIIPKSYFELIENDANGTVQFGETLFSKLTDEDWKTELDKLLKSQVVCNSQN